MTTAIGWRDEDATAPKPTEPCRCGATTWTWYRPEQRFICAGCGAYPRRSRTVSCKQGTPDLADVEPRHDPDHPARILCGGCAWEIARAVDVSSHPELDATTPGRWPMVPVSANGNGWQLPPEPRRDWEVWSPTASLRNRTRRAVEDLLAGRISRDAAIRQARPRLPAKTRLRLERDGLPIHHMLHVPCGVVCPACDRMNWLRSWSPTTGLP